MMARAASSALPDTPLPLLGLPLLRLPRYQQFTHGGAPFGPVAFAVGAEDFVELLFEDLSRPLSAEEDRLNGFISRWEMPRLPQ